MTGFVVRIAASATSRISRGANWVVVLDKLEKVVVVLWVDAHSYQLVRPVG